MAEFKSDQVTKLDASPREQLATNEAGGRVRQAFFRHAVEAGNLVNDTISLIEVPAGARILGGKIAFQAMSSAAGTAQVQLGDGTTAGKYLGTTSVDAAGEADFAHTVALNYGEKLTEKLRLTATILGEAWAAGQVFTGHLLYVHND